MAVHTSYIDDIALAIHKEVEPLVAPEEDLPLYRLYAVLLLAKGEAVTDEDVHNAYSAWASEHQPDLRSLVPFGGLPEFVQQMDRPYTAAICAVARWLRPDLPGWERRLVLGKQSDR